MLKITQRNVETIVNISLKLENQQTNYIIHIFHIQIWITINENNKSYNFYVEICYIYVYNIIYKSTLYIKQKISLNVFAKKNIIIHIHIYFKKYVFKLIKTTFV